MKLLIFFTIFSFFVPEIVAAQITLGNKKNGDYILDSDIKKIQRLENIPSNMSVQSFKMSITTNGYEEFYVSESAFLTDEQKSLIHKALPGTRIVISDIKLNNPKHKLNKKPFVDYSFFVIKDQMVLDTWRDSMLISQHCTHYLQHHPAIYVYPSISSCDTTKMRITKFKISSIQPDGYYNFKKYSGNFDNQMLQFIKNARYNFSITDVQAVENIKNPRDTFYFDEIKILANNPPIIYRSKYSFSLKQEFDIFSQMFDNEIDSFYVDVEDLNLNKETETYHFLDNMFSKEFVKMIRSNENNLLLHFTMFCRQEKKQISVKLIP